jgi:hypothetical protein
MSNYNTGNPVPSIDPRDLDDNATVFDNLLQSSAASVPDRLGAQRKTWHQMELDAATLVSPNVSALASAVSAANKIFYFTGSGTGAVADFPAQARTLLAATTTALQRTALALGTAAVANVQSSTSDATALAALIVGAFGLGGNPLSVTEATLNNTRPTQFMIVSASAGGVLPENINSYGLRITNASAGFAMDILFPVTGGNAYYRKQISGAWDATWTKFSRGGANSDITSLTGLTTPLSIAQGGTGNTAGSAVKLTTARNIAITGDATYTTSFDGSANVTGALTLAASGVGAGTYDQVVVDVKGRVTGGVANTAFTVATLVNSWTVVASRRAVYRKTMDNLQLDITITGGTATNGTTLFTLPAGFRPVILQAVPVISGPNTPLSTTVTPPFVFIDTTGVVSCQNCSNGVISFSATIPLV